MVHLGEWTGTIKPVLSGWCFGWSQDLAAIAVRGRCGLQGIGETLENSKIFFDLFSRDCAPSTVGCRIHHVSVPIWILAPLTMSSPVSLMQLQQSFPPRSSVVGVDISTWSLRQ